MNEKTADTLKVVGVNVALVCILITLLNVFAVAFTQFFKATKSKQYAKSHNFPNYKGVDWAFDHFSEYDNLTKGYFKSFVGWRRPEYKGKTININKHGMRHTVHVEGSKPVKTIALYGGSTMWGTGTNDATTISSFIARANPEFKAMNFGETGYIAHQSFNRFFESYSAGFRPEVVVFYDGVNDVWNRCRREHTSFSHSREYQIRLHLQEQRDASWLDVVAPMADLAGRVKRTMASRSQRNTGFYDCKDDPKKAERVARNLLHDWLLMKNIVEGYGGRFIAILQPHAYISKSPVDHLKLEASLGHQYAAVYARVMELLPKHFSALQPNFMDLRTALDQDHPVYIDWCHLSPNGNKIIAARISERLRSISKSSRAQDGARKG